MKCQRQPLDVKIKGAAEIMRDPLCDAGGEIFLCIRADCVEYRDHNDKCARKLKNGNFVIARGGKHKPVQPSVNGPGLQNVVQYNFQRPGFKQVSNALADYSKQTQA